MTLADWAEQHGVMLEFIKPGKPMQNGFIERFNRSYREAVLDMFVFQSLSEVREQTEKWMKEYNEERPHESLGHMTPREYLLTPNRKSLLMTGPKLGRVTESRDFEWWRALCLSAALCLKAGLAGRSRHEAQGSAASLG